MTLERLLEKYGQRVKVHRPGAGEDTETRAFVQTIQERSGSREDRLPSPLGLRRQARLTYLGGPEVPMEGLEDGWVEFQGRRYEVRGAQSVWVGEKLSHWWALLVPRDGEEET